MSKATPPRIEREPNLPRLHNEISRHTTMGGQGSHIGLNYLYEQTFRLGFEITESLRLREDREVRKYYGLGEPVSASNKMVTLSWHNGISVHCPNSVFMTMEEFDKIARRMGYVKKGED